MMGKNVTAGEIPFRKAWIQAIVPRITSSGSSATQPTSNMPSSTARQHLKQVFAVLYELARPKRFELLTPRFVVWCSIQLSYGRAVRRAGV